MNLPKGFKEFRGESGKIYKFSVFELEDEIRTPEGWDFEPVVCILSKCDFKNCSKEHEVIHIDESDNLGNMLRTRKELPQYINEGANSLCIMIQKNEGFRLQIMKDLSHLRNTRSSED